MSDAVRVGMWSGPRNISTAMMRAFENRADTEVVDEPLYAAYLHRTGLDHPVRDEVIASQPTDVAAAVAGPRAAALPRPPRSTTPSTWPTTSTATWTCAGRSRFRNVLLIRDPAEVVASYVRARESCEPEDIGIPQQGWLLELWDDHGHEVPIVDAGDFLRAPEAHLALAVRLARRPLHRADALVAARPARLRRRLGAALVRRRVEVDRLRALAPAGDRLSRATTPPSPRPAARPTTALHARRVRV